jgi:hypothetical protein
MTISDRDAIARKMCATVPRCIGEFAAERAERPEPRAGTNISAWNLYCSCGSGDGAVLGYPLRRYNLQYQGDAFVGPIGFECAKCKRILEALDSNRHGYHAEACASPSHICGAGPRDKFTCHNCGSAVFALTVSFFYWEASIDLVEDEPQVFAERAQDLFFEFVAHGRCANCNRLLRLTDFGKF